MRASILTAHMAATFLSANGYVAFSSNVDSLKELSQDEKSGVNFINRALKMA